MKMFREDKEKWIAALESGEYSQAVHTLHDPNTGGFCCLGVLEHCLMNGKVESRGDGHFRGTPTENFYNRFGIVNYFGEAPASACAAAGADKQFGLQYETLLMGMNDSSIVGTKESRTFKQIARWIRKYVKVHKHDRNFKVPKTYENRA